jgi:3-isopropylmalate/(R)-2-methylmalate dehydratase small subunit
MKAFDGKVLFLDRDDINTDEIIPAKYLSEASKAALKPNCMEDLRLEGFDPGRDLRDKTAILSRGNFGCGSSREHAPWALEVNGINAVVAASFARIFRGNMFNGGMLAISLGADSIGEIFRTFKGKEKILKVDWKRQEVCFRAEGLGRSYPMSLGDFDKALVEAGGWVEYASAHY